MIEEITTFIRDKAALLPAPVALLIGTDLFMGHRPQDCNDNCDVVLETTGGEIFFDLPERADPVIQVLSRGDTYFTARIRAHVIFDAIFRMHTFGSAGWTLPVIIAGVKYEAMAIVPLSPPQHIGQDEKLRYEFSTNYIFKLKRI